MGLELALCCVTCSSKRENGCGGGGGGECIPEAQRTTENPQSIHTSGKKSIVSIFFSISKFNVISRHSCFVFTACGFVQILSKYF